MYSWELTNYLTEHNCTLNQNEYLHICNTCPQIRRVKYEPYGNYFEIWTDDNGYFKFTVNYEKQGE